jgi:rhodanese-related sulfurtransferase
MRIPPISPALLLAAAALLALFAAAPVRGQDAKKEKEPEGAEKISIERFEEMRKAKDVVVLDVRTPEEFKAGRVPGARNVDVKDEGFAERLKSLDKDKTYLVYCRTGRRSNAATATMKELGFAKLYNFAGSMVEWEKAGKPVEKGEAKGE